MYLDVAFYLYTGAVSRLTNNVPLFQTSRKNNVKTIPTLHGISCKMCRIDSSKSIFVI